MSQPELGGRKPRTKNTPVGGANFFPARTATSDTDTTEPPLRNPTHTTTCLFILFPFSDGVLFGWFRGARRRGWSKSDSVPLVFRSVDGSRCDRKNVSQRTFSTGARATQREQRHERATSPWHGAPHQNTHQRHRATPAERTRKQSRDIGTDPSTRETHLEQRVDAPSRNTFQPRPNQHRAKGTSHRRLENAIASVPRSFWANYPKDNPTRVSSSGKARTTGPLRLVLVFQPRTRKQNISESPTERPKKKR